MAHLSDARGAHLFEDLLRQGLGDAQERDLAARRLKSFLHLEREHADVAVHAVVHDGDSGCGGGHLDDGCGRAAASEGWNDAGKRVREDSGGRAGWSPEVPRNTGIYRHHI